MSEDSFILVNLKEAKSKKLAQVISNDTSRKILDFLTKGDSTETEIAKELKVPISTVHYNLKHLTQANLVQVDEFHYSEKGKEVDHYKLSNKFVIIAPQTSKLDNLKQKLGKILPVALLSLAGAGAIQLISSFQKTTFGLAAPLAEKAADMSVDDVALKVAPEAFETAPQAASNVTQIITQEHNIALWFLLGALFALIIYFLIDFFRKK